MMAFLVMKWRVQYDDDEDSDYDEEPDMAMNMKSIDGVYTTDEEVMMIKDILKRQWRVWWWWLWQFYSKWIWLFIILTF